MDSEGLLELVLKRISQWSFFITLSISIASLTGWFFGLLVLVNINPHYIPIAPSSALCFSLSSASLLAYVFRPESHSRRVVAASGASLTLLISLIILIGFSLGTTFYAELLGIQTPPPIDNIPVGHMSPISAVTFLMVSAGIFFLVFPSESGARFKQLSAFLATAVVLIGVTICLGYLTGTPLLYGGKIIPVSLSGAIAFEFISLGMMTASGAHVLPVQVFVGSTVSNRLTRAFVPATVFLIMLAGFLYHEAFLRATNPALATSLILLLSIIIVGIIISHIARSIGGDIDRAHEERDRAEVILRHLATRDSLTGLANRRAFDAFLDEECRRALRGGYQISMMMIDVDYFKKYNDTYGHLKGDECLRQLAGILKDVARRPGDIAARFGGEEFAVVLSMTEVQYAVSVADKIRMGVEALKVPHEKSKINDYLTVSIGVVTEIPQQDMCPFDIIQYADEALYKAKNGGRNKVVFINPKK